MKTPLTLTIVHRNSEVLLGMKKRGFGAGRWNGFGGKLLDNETVEGAAKRELREEAGITTLDLKKLGIIEFEFKGNPEILEVHVFKSEKFSGDPRESDEMKPKWFSVDKIPFDAMWPDDKYWMPLFLAGKKFRGRYLFGKEDVILEQKLEEVINPPVKSTPIFPKISSENRRKWRSAIEITRRDFRDLQPKFLGKVEWKRVLYLGKRFNRRVNNSL